MFIKSIRWRLQLWLAFLLICTLSGFAIATYEGHRVKQYQQVDDQLSRRFDLLSLLARGPMFPGRGRPPLEDGPRRQPPWEPRNGVPGDSPRGGPPPTERDSEPLPERLDGRPPFDLGDRTNSNAMARPGPGGPEFRPPPNLERFRQEDEQYGIYFVVWNRDGVRIDGSTNAPAGVTYPAQSEPADSGPYYRNQGDRREVYDFNREGRCVLVGRSIAVELAGLRSFAVMLAVAWVGVLTLGLAGGWVIASQAIRPVETISAAASRISAGHLSERINVADTDSELGRLAAVLNSTFARLETAFAQQQQFTADASHELRTPIAVIISEAQTTLARERTAPEYRETIEACLDTAQQMRRLTESLLELAHLDARQVSAKRERLDLAELARSRAEFLQPLADERRLRLHCTFAPANTSGDADQLGLVLNNLLSNAIYYNKPNGEIVVTTGVESGQAFVTIADTGQGIAPEDLPLIFNRFYRADKSRSRAEGRSGLGLAICKVIVEAHGGSIEVASELGVGSTFTVRLPA